jgi:NhaA family Na+:H+ antiporter
VWASDGLLAVFFFIVGNELKQEIRHGELRNPRRAAVPIVAALGGVLVPAVTFLAINVTDPEAVRGWGIPMATDIAFALAVLAVVGRHLPGSLRTFLLTLATVDDMCAVVVIAVFYTKGLSWLALAAAVAGLAMFGYLQNGRGRLARWLLTRIPGWLIYGILAVVIWGFAHASGVHATISAVAMGLLMRTKARPGETVSPSLRAEQVLRPVAAGLSLPVFALMSTGISVSGTEGIWSSTITWGILIGLVVGKLVGILGGAWLTARLTSAHLNPRLAWADIAGIAVLGGIGFTVSLLVAELSYTRTENLTDAKAAILLASTTSALLSAIVLAARNRHHRHLAGKSP